MIGSQGHKFICDLDGFINRYHNKTGIKKPQPELYRKVLSEEELDSCICYGLLRKTFLVDKLYKHKVYTNPKYEEEELIKLSIAKKCKNSDLRILDMEALRERYFMETKKSVRNSNSSSGSKQIMKINDDKLKDIMLFREYLSKGITLDGLNQLINEYYKENDIEQNNSIYTQLNKQIKRLQQNYTRVELKNVIIKSSKVVEPTDKIKKLLSKGVADMTANEFNIVKEYKESTKTENRNEYNSIIIKVDYSIPELSSYGQYEKYITNSNILAVYDKADNFIAYDTIRY